MCYQNLYSLILKLIAAFLLLGGSQMPAMQHGVNAVNQEHSEHFCALLLVFGVRGGIYLARDVLARLPL